MSISSRIKEARTAKKLTQEELAKKVDITKGAIANYENDVSVPRVDILYKIMNVLDVDANYIYQDEMENTPEAYTPREQNLVNNYRTLKPLVQESVYNLVDTLADKKEQKEKTLHNNVVEFPINEETVEIPLMGNTAAGNPMELIEGIYTGDTLTVPIALKGCFALKVCGDSMEPKIPYGSYVAVKKQSAVDCGEIGIFFINGEVTCKKYKIKNGVAELHSINPKYKPITFCDYDDARVLGKVIDLI